MMINRGKRSLIKIFCLVTRFFLSPDCGNGSLKTQKDFSTTLGDAGD